MHQRVALARTDGLDQDEVEAKRFQETNERVEMLGKRAAATGCREAADEDAGVIGASRHAEAVAEQSAAAQRTLRIAREHGDGLPVLPGHFDELADECTLADAAAP